MQKSGNRRKFLRDITLTVSALVLGSNLPLQGCREQPYSKSAPFDIMKEISKYRKINTHEHGWPYADPANLIKIADKMEIEKLVISTPITNPDRLATPDEFRECNDLVLKAMKQFPDRFMGQVFINPIYGSESLREIDRCIGLGMTGLKIYNQVKINDPLLYPVIEKFIDLKMIILVHSHCGLGVGGHRTKYGNVQPNASIPEDFAEAASRYPEAMFQYAHLCGPGDWEYACKMLSPYPNVYADLSGSNNEANVVNFALEHFGEDRLFFGTDLWFYQGLGVVLSSEISDIRKKKIFFDNYNEILRKSGNHVD